MKKEFAVVETGGKQYLVSMGDALSVEKIAGDFTKGDSITFDKVLLIDDGAKTVVGTPYIDGAEVTVSFEIAGKAKKVTVIRYKQKSRYFKKRGHRQPFTKVRVASVKKA